MMHTFLLVSPFCSPYFVLVEDDFIDHVVLTYIQLKRRSSRTF
jgi:hypothetical protein